MKTIICLAFVIAAACTNIKQNEKAQPLKSIRTYIPKDSLLRNANALTVNRAQLKRTWLGSCYVKKDFIGEYYEKSGYNLLKEEDKIGDLSLIVMKTFRLSYSDLMSWTPNEPIEQLLTFDSTQLNVCAYIKQRIYFSIQFKKQDLTWKFVGYGPVFKSFADSLSNIIFNKKRSIYTVYSMDSNAPNAYRQNYLIYDTPYGLQCLRVGGVSASFKDVLIDYKKNLQSGRIF